MTGIDLELLKDIELGSERVVNLGQQSAKYWVKHWVKESEGEWACGKVGN
jgi:hypothetical protein